MLYCSRDEFDQRSRNRSDNHKYMMLREIVILPVANRLPSACNTSSSYFNNLVHRSHRSNGITTSIGLILICISLSVLSRTWSISHLLAVWQDVSVKSSSTRSHSQR